MKIEWTKPDNLGITWEHDNMMPKPYEEITHDIALRLLFTHGHGLLGINYSDVYIGWDVLGEKHSRRAWRAEFRWFLSYGIAVCARYDCHHPPHSWVPKTDMGLGIFVKAIYEGDKKNPYGHFMRFFRLGCKHENMRKVTHKMFDHEDICPDCGYKFRYDSSG